MRTSVWLCTRVCALLLLYAVLSVGQSPPVCDATAHDNLSLELSARGTTAAPAAPNADGYRQVSVHLEILRALFDHASHRLRVSARLRLRWNDSRLAWNTVDKCGIASTEVAAGTIWVPGDRWGPSDGDVEYGSTGGRKSDGVDTAIAYVSSNGEVELTRTASVAVVCVMDFTYAPLDRHTCELLVSASSIRTRFVVDPADGGFSLGPAADEEVDFDLLDAPSVGVVGYKFIQNRHAGKVIITHFVPLWLILLLSYCGLWVDPWSAPARATMAITTVLVLVTFDIRTVDTTEQVTLQDAYKCLCYLFCTCNSAEFVLMNYLLSRLRDRETSIKVRKDIGTGLQSGTGKPKSSAAGLGPDQADLLKNGVSHLSEVRRVLQEQLRLVKNDRKRLRGPDGRFLSGHYDAGSPLVTGGVPFRRTSTSYPFPPAHLSMSEPPSNRNNQKLHSGRVRRNQGIGVEEERPGAEDERPAGQQPLRAHDWAAALQASPVEVRASDRSATAYDRPPGLQPLRASDRPADPEAAPDGRPDDRRTEPFSDDVAKPAGPHSTPLQPISHSRARPLETELIWDESGRGAAPKADVDDSAWKPLESSGFPDRRGTWADFSDESDGSDSTDWEGGEVQGKKKGRREQLELAELEEVFEAFNESCTGWLTQQERRAVLESLGITDPQQLISLLGDSTNTRLKVGDRVVLTPDAVDREGAGLSPGEHGIVLKIESRQQEFHGGLSKRVHLRRLRDSGGVVHHAAQMLVRVQEDQMAEDLYRPARVLSAFPSSPNSTRREDLRRSRFETKSQLEATTARKLARVSMDDRPPSALQLVFEKPLWCDGVEWRTVEHFYQASKFPEEPEAQQKIREAEDAGVAYVEGKKRLEDRLFHSDWGKVRGQVMLEALRLVSENGEVRKAVLSTGDRLIRLMDESEYWGIGKTGQGLNMFGLTLMTVRSELRNRRDFLDEEQELKWRISDYYNSRGPYQHHFMISKVEKIYRNKRTVVSARYRYVPVPGGPATGQEGGTDFRTFFFSKDRSDEAPLGIVYKMGPHQSGRTWREPKRGATAWDKEGFIAAMVAAGVHRRREPLAIFFCQRAMTRASVLRLERRFRKVTFILPVIVTVVWLAILFAQ